MLEKMIHWVGKVLSYISPTLASKYWYYQCFDRKLDLNNPVTLNEKLMWLKLNTYRNNPLVTQCADKYRVREYVKQAGCPELLNELYGVWDSVDEIPWDTLPDAFVMKCNHGCGYNILCPDKKNLDISDAEEKLDRWMHEAFWRRLSEVQYQHIPKKIICEEFLGSGEDLYDYKIYCFHGKAEYLLVCAGREKGKPKFYFFDRNWNLAPITRDGKNAPADFTIEKPARLEQMLQYAQQLAAPFPFVRVDLYYVKEKIYFGELTFVPSAALDDSRLPETDILFGEMLDLSL